MKDVFDYREKNNIERNDFLQLLMELKKEGKIKNPDYISEEIDCKLFWLFYCNYC